MSATNTTLEVHGCLLTSVIGAVRIGVIVLDDKQCVVLWNRWMEQHSQISATAVLGKPFIELFPSMVNSRMHQAIKEALRDNFSSLISQTLNKTPFPLYHSQDDAAKNIRLQQAVQIMPIEIASLPRHCLIQVIDVSMAVERERQLREQALELQSQTFSDGLTGVANRRRFDIHIADEFRRAKRIASPLSLVMIDVDYFKSYNDNYGHQQGDQCLVRIARALASVLGRPCDLLARYGGEEFVAVLPDTNAEGVLKIAETMRTKVEMLKLEHAYTSSESKHVTVSLGIVTQIPQQHTSISHMIGAADSALYKAKRSGRNCIVVYSNHMDAEENSEV